ncbi:MAG: hypothetical protein ABSC48_18185 [Terracidiphilus sp.]|jgi:hypothetical protein
MTANLRPLTLREILDGSLRIYRGGFFVFAGIASFPALAYAALSTIGRMFGPNQPNSGKYLLFHMTLSGLSSKAAMYFVQEFIHLLFYPAFACVTVGAITGQRSSLRPAIAAFRNRAKEFLALALALATVEVLVPALLFIGSAALIGRIADAHAGGALAAGAELVFVLIVLLIVGFIVSMGTSLAFSFPASVLEGAAWLESLKRSWALSRGCRAKIFLVWLLIFVVGMGLILLVVLPTDILVFALHWKRFAWHGYPLYRLLNLLEIVLVSTLLGPIFPIVLTLIYYDQRIRHEGYDIERMMDAAGMNAPVAPHPGDGPAAPAEAGEGQD